MPLSDTTIRNTKPRRKPFKLFDGGGLYLLIQPHGTKLWRKAYRINGKHKTLAFGIYPTVSLADARAKRDAAKRVLQDGGDPSVLRKIDKQGRGNSFRLVAGELLDKMKREGRAPATLAKTQWLLDFAFDVIGDRPVAKITAPELLAVLRKISRAANMKQHGVCAVPAVWYFATPLQPRGPNATRLSICAVH